MPACHMHARHMQTRRQQAAAASSKQQQAAAAASSKQRPLACSLQLTRTAARAHSSTRTQQHAHTAARAHKHTRAFRDSHSRPPGGSDARALPKRTRGRKGRVLSPRCIHRKRKRGHSRGWRARVGSERPQNNAKQRTSKERETKNAFAAPRCPVGQKGATQERAHARAYLISRSRVCQR